MRLDQLILYKNNILGVVYLKFVGAVLKHRGKFLNYVELMYEYGRGNAKVYETVQRGLYFDENAIGHHRSESVTIVAFSEDRKKLLLNKEFRLSVNREVYNLPAGLIEKGETVEESVKRELKEETGLDIVSIDRILPASFVSIGESNSCGNLVYVTASGELHNDNNPIEPITPLWISKEDASKILKTDGITARTQCLLDLWVNGFNT